MKVSERIKAIRSILKYRLDVGSETEVEIDYQLIQLECEIVEMVQNAKEQQERNT